MLVTNPSKNTSLQTFMQRTHEGVITQGECNGLSTEQISELFKTSMSNLKTAYAESREILGQNQETPLKSASYSIQLVKAERAFLSLQNIRSLLPQIEPQEIKEAESLLQEMSSNLPFGPTVLLPSDFQKLKTISSIPPSPIYEFKGKLFFEPQISLTDLGGFFDVKEYEGASSCRTTDTLFHKKFDGPFSYVALKKIKASTNQAGEATSLMSKSMKVLAKPGNWAFWLGKKAYSYTSYYNPVDIPKMRKEYLDFVRKNLSIWNAENHWGFAYFLIYNYEDLIQMGVPSSRAVEADFILFFHRPCEEVPQDHP